MTEGKIPGTDLKNSYYRSYCPDTLKTYQRETKLFEFSPDTNMGELKIKQRRHFAMALLQWFSLVPFIYVYKKTTIYLDNEVYRKISTHFQGLENANENAVLASQTFSQWLRGSKCPIIPAVQAGNVSRNVDISYTKKTKVGLKKICNSY